MYICALGHRLRICLEDHLSFPGRGRLQDPLPARLTIPDQFRFLVGTLLSLSSLPLVMQRRVQQLAQGITSLSISVVFIGVRISLEKMVFPRSKTIICNACVQTNRILCSYREPWSGTPFPRGIVWAVLV